MSLSPVRIRIFGLVMTSISVAFSTTWALSGTRGRGGLFLVGVPVYAFSPILTSLRPGQSVLPFGGGDQDRLAGLRRPDGGVAEAGVGELAPLPSSSVRTARSVFLSVVQQPPPVSSRVIYEPAPQSCELWVLRP